MDGSNRIRAVSYGTDGRYTTHNAIPALNDLAALLRKMPDVDVSIWTLDRLASTVYWTAHNNLATGPRCGHKSWKAQIVMRELMAVNDGDIVLYLDADVRWRGDLVGQFANLAHERGVALRKFRCANREFTQRDTFILMGMDGSKYWHAPHVFAGMIAIERNNWTLQFVNDWQVASLSYDVIAKRESTRGDELDGFKAHRREQSILGILAAHYGIEPYQIEDLFIQGPWPIPPRGYEADRAWEWQR